MTFLLNVLLLIRGHGICPNIYLRSIPEQWVDMPFLYDSASTDFYGDYISL